MKSKFPIAILIILIAILAVLLIFSSYKKAPETQEGIYTVEEIIEPEEPTEEPEEIPTMQETEEEVEILHEIDIEISNWRFYPDEVTISPGTTVTWISKDNIPHKVVSYTRVFYGPRLQPGEKYSFTFTKPGIYKYFDAVFPKAGKGTIIVQEEPLPITGGAVGINQTNNSGKFALLVLLFTIMVLALSHGMYTHYKT